MSGPNNAHGFLWERGEEYRQSVIRKAVLLGFQAYEYNTHGATLWAFMHEGKERNHYGTIYGAAYDFLRLNNLTHLI